MPPGSAPASPVLHWDMGSPATTTEMTHWTAVYLQYRAGISNPNTGGLNTYGNSTKHVKIA
uniref:Uncharacterized protein n=2 Tax=Anguilla anguilla TaxID=7936 RepID=A0A0E9U234_ANGAN